MKAAQILSPTKMSADSQTAADFRVKYSRRIDSDGREQEHSEVEMLDDGEQHPDVGLQAAGKQEINKLLYYCKVLTSQNKVL